MGPLGQSGVRAARLVEEASPSGREPLWTELEDPVFAETMLRRRFAMWKIVLHLLASLWGPVGPSGALVRLVAALGPFIG